MPTIVACTQWKFFLSSLIREKWLFCRLAGSGLAILLVLMTPVALKAQEAWLLTYGPGEEVWELFGHNAIWIRDQDRDLDHTFSFGYFDLDRPGFHRDFARGIMPYYGAATIAEREFEFYRQRDRSIRAQRLDLSVNQVNQLTGLLNEAIFPIPQYYPYDYYLANCSTWLRDMINRVTDQSLEGPLKALPARLNFRDHTRRLTAHRFWLHSGIMTLLGPPVDRPISRWDEAFLPESLAESLAGIEIDGKRLVIEDRQLYESGREAPPSSATGPWMASLLLGGLSLALLLWSGLTKRARLAGLVRSSCLLAAGLSGIVIMLMWLVSGHEATWRNAMLMLLNPLWLAFLLPGLERLKAGLWWLVLVGVLVGSVYLLMPAGQFRPDQVYWYAPLCAGLLFAVYSDLAARRSR